MCAIGACRGYVRLVDAKIGEQMKDTGKGHEVKVKYRVLRVLHVIIVGGRDVVSAMKSLMDLHLKNADNVNLFIGDEGEKD